MKMVFILTFQESPTKKILDRPQNMGLKQGNFGGIPDNTR